jgi:hypothetical protein
VQRSSRVVLLIVQESEVLVVLVVGVDDSEYEYAEHVEEDSEGRPVLELQVNQRSHQRPLQEVLYHCIRGHVLARAVHQLVAPVEYGRAGLVPPGGVAVSNVGADSYVWKE